MDPGLKTDGKVINLAVDGQEVIGLIAIQDARRPKKRSKAQERDSKTVVLTGIMNGW